MHHFRSISAFLVSLGFVAGIGSATAHAAGHKSRYQGNLCVSGSNAGTAWHDLHGVGNVSSSQEITVYCPIPIDSISGVTPTLTYVGIGGFDRNTGLNIVCNVFMTYLDDGALVNLGTFNTAFGGPGSGLTSVGLSMNSDFGNALQLQCSIPRTQQNWISHLSYYEVHYTTS